MYKDNKFLGQLTQQVCATTAVFSLRERAEAEYAYFEGLFAHAVENHQQNTGSLPSCIWVGIYSTAALAHLTVDPTAEKTLNAQESVQVHKYEQQEAFGNEDQRVTQAQAFFNRLGLPVPVVVELLNDPTPEKPLQAIVDNGGSYDLLFVGQGRQMGDGVVLPTHGMASARRIWAYHNPQEGSFGQFRQAVLAQMQGQPWRERFAPVDLMTEQNPARKKPYFQLPADATV